MSSLPDPVRVRLGMRIQSAELDALHAHSAGPDTETVTMPPSAPMRACDRSSVNRQGAAACVIMTRRSLTTRAPVRELARSFATAVSVTSDSPWPDDGDTWIQEASLERLQTQSRAAVTTTVTLPPPGGNSGGEPTLV
jgi:hypothetical protein